MEGLKKYRVTYDESVTHEVYVIASSEEAALEMAKSAVEDDSVEYGEIKPEIGVYAGDWESSVMVDDFEVQDIEDLEENTSLIESMNTKLAEDVGADKAKLNKLCQWCVDMDEDKDALFFGAGLKGFLLKGHTLERYIKDYGDKSRAFFALVEDFNDCCDQDFSYKIVDLFPDDNCQIEIILN